MYYRVLTAETIEASLTIERVPRGPSAVDAEVMCPTPCAHGTVGYQQLLALLGSRDGADAANDRPGQVFDQSGNFFLGVLDVVPP